ncbi:MAG: hypothetical protein AAFP92_18975, partial [Bacteroidota bacterium]
MNPRQFVFYDAENQPLNPADLTPEFYIFLQIIFHYTSQTHCSPFSLPPLLRYLINPDSYKLEEVQINNSEEA